MELIYGLFTAASVFGLIAGVYRLVNRMPLWRSFMCMAPVVGLLAHVPLRAGGYEVLALFSLALATAFVFVGGLVYVCTGVPLDELLVPRHKHGGTAADTVVQAPLAPAAKVTEIRPTKHCHLRVVR